MKATLIIALALLAHTGLSQSADSSDHVDLLYLADAQPVMIRLQPRIAGKTIREAWEDYVAALFRRLDADNNHSLSPLEAAGAPTPVELMQAGFLDSAVDKLGDPDHDPRDGTVTQQELSKYFDAIGAKAFSIRAVHPRIPGDVNSGVFQYLDGDGDHKLSGAELSDAFSSLQKYDRNDDEFIGRVEIGLARSLSEISSFTPSRNRTSARSDWIRLSSTAPRSVCEAILAHYDRSADGILDKRECPGETVVFQRLDGNTDGVIDAAELDRFVRAGFPVVEITLRIDTDDQPEVEATKIDAALAPNTSQKSDELAVVMLSRTQIELRAPARATVESDDSRYKQIFERTDADKNGYLDINEARRFVNFRNTFEAMDRDNDEKVFLREMLTHIINQAELAKALTILTVTDRGQDLALILDRNRDLRLSRRELIGALDRLDAWDANGDRRMGRDEIPRQYELSLGRGQPNLFRFPEDRSTTGANRSDLPDAPLWFVRLDANGDGELSRREFLGSLPRFRQFDKNNDGLISVNELD